MFRICVIVVCLFVIMTLPYFTVTNICDGQDCIYYNDSKQLTNLKSNAEV